MKIIDKETGQTVSMVKVSANYPRFGAPAGLSTLLDILLAKGLLSAEDIRPFLTDKYEVVDTEKDSPARRAGTEGEE